MNNQSASEKLWDTWHGLFDFFNDELFNSELDRNRVILNCSRASGRSTLGFYMGFLKENLGAWIEQNGNEQKAEISMNPSKMKGYSHEEIMATFVHELCHFWQDLHGSPGKKGYHNQEWANKMLEVGLKPINNKNGKQTGMSMHHSIIEDGRFAKLVKDLPDNLKLPFLGLATGKSAVKNGYKKWMCPFCNQICRAKETSQIACVPCTEHSFANGDNEIVSMI